MAYLEQLAPILILLTVVAVVIGRLPKIDLGHSDAFRRRRVLNWLPLGLTYAFLYMGRYNVKVSKLKLGDLTDAEGLPLMSNADFATIFGYGTLVYGMSFVLNGPMTDRIGGKRAILIGAGGALTANAAMGLCTQLVLGDRDGWLANNLTLMFSLLYAANMYFQSFGAVAIVKVNAPWFHVRERGVFGAIFGVLISLGIYFAFDWGKLILDHVGLTWVFYVPAILLALFFGIVTVFVRNTPGEAGHVDFDTADASSGDDGERLPVKDIFLMMLRNPIIVTIAFVEFCSGFLRQAIMQWYREFAKQTDGTLDLAGSFVYDNWGLLLCCAGILGGVVAGVISDRLFDSRRGPVAALLYGVMLVGAVVLLFAYQEPFVGWLVILMSMAVIGVHGMLSGTASMDFGGKKNVGTAVGIIDGFVYLGTFVMSMTYGVLLPDDKHHPEQAADPDNWIWWPGAMIPMALIGLVLASRLWNAKPKPKTPSAPKAPKKEGEPATF
ncbi:MAG TPA: MFS transporter [Polyangiaceae bacterium LLY-WYZ-15_(1-7)]|nr:MFS transporter [Myxococcales bacterium]MAT28708.1 MFS transporter [Sandaracinus sp.]HJK89263.1 MFS transporter [Polyangiaceae bacterium LLY-WYZ-15_(1-7)]MBJ69853.1 MFS transporter [Sandaracinus sp.]HJL02210.1 MFS transporter [Polyangiaceae bacterium LLY-WYZ-15_(1-7)]